MPKYLPLPDGSSVTVQKGETPQQAWFRAQQQYPDAFGITPEEEKPKEKKPKKGFASDIGLGLESLLSSQRTAAESLTDKNEAVKRGIERSAQLGEKYGPQEGWEEVAKKYEESGLLPAVGEFVRQVPHALAQQAPQIAESMGAARLGAMAGPVGAGVGAFAPSFLQQYGGFLEAQAEEQRKRGEPVDVNRLTAAGAAIPAALIDVAATYIPMGRGIMKAVFGPGVEKLLAKGMTKEAEKIAAAKLADEGFVKSLAKGTAKGAAFEIPGEVAQDILERAQSGQSLFDNDALASYGKTAFETSKLGPLGALGRFSDKSSARALMAEEQRKEQAKQLEQQQALEEKEKQKQEAYKQSDEYITDLTQRWTAFDTQYKDLLAKKKAKVANDDLVGQADKKEAQTALSELLKDPANQELINEYRAVKSKVDAEKAAAEKARAAEEQAKVEAEKKAAYDLSMQKYGAQGELFGGTSDQDLIEASRAQQQAPTENVLSAKEFNNQAANIARGLYLARQNAVEANEKQNKEAVATHLQEHNALKEAQQELEKQRPLVQKAEPNERLYNVQDLNFEDTDIELAKQRAKQDKALQLGDMDAAAKAQAKIDSLVQRPTLFGTENKREEAEKRAEERERTRTRAPRENALDQTRLQFTEEIEANRQASVEQRKKIEDEVARLQKIVDANKQPSIFANAVEQRKADIAKKELEDAKALLAKFNQQPYKTATGEIIMPPKLTQDWHALKEEPTYAQENIEGEPTNYELLDKRIEELLNQQLPIALGEKPVTKGKPNVERRVHYDENGKPDGGIQTVVTRDNGRVAQNVTRYTYNVTSTDGEVQQIRIEHDNLNNETEGYFVVGGRPVGSGIGIKNLIANGVSHVDAIKRVVPDIAKVNKTKTTEETPDLLTQNQPIESATGRPVAPSKTVEQRRKTLEKIRDFIYRIKELKKRIPAMHAEVMRGIEHPEYPELIKEYQYLQGRLEELQNVSERVQGPGRYLPIVEAQELLETVDTNKKILADLNESIQKAGNPTDPAKVKELEMLRERRAYIQQEIEDARAKYNKLAAREQKPAARETEEQGDLFGLAGEYAKSGKTVQKIKNTLDRLYKERDELKAGFQRRTKEATTPILQNLLLKYSKEPTGRYEELAKEIELNEQELMNATGKTSEKFQAFADEREAQKTPVEQTAEQKLLPGFGLKQYNEIKKPVSNEDMMAAKTRQINLQTQLENLRKQSGRISNPAMEAKLQEQIEKAKAKVADLERKQRAYEDQQDAINKAPPGQRAAKRLIAGEGYTTYTGKVRTNPKNPESWGLTGAERTPTDKPSALVKAAAKKRQAKKLVETATKEREEAGANETVAQARARLLQLENAVSILTEQLQHANKLSLKELQRRLELAQADFDIAQTMAANTPPQELAKVTKELKDAEDALAKLISKPVLGPAEDLARYKHEVSLLTAHIRNIRRELPLENAAEKLKEAKEAYDAMSKSMAYSPFEKNAETRKEISVLQAFIKKHSTRKVINNAKSILARFKEPIDPAEVGRLAIQMQNNLANAKTLIEPFIKRLDDLRFEYEALTKPGAFQAEVAAMGPGILQSRIDRVLEEAKEIDKLHTAAVVRYAMARRDLLAFQYASSLGLQEEYKKAVEARDKERARQAKNPALQENLAQIESATKTQAKAEDILNAAIEKEKKETGKFNAKQRAEEEEEIQALKDAQTISGGVPKEVFQRVREGLGLEGTRVEKDTSGPLAQAVQNNAKKMLGMAQTQLIAVEEAEKKIKERIKEAEENLDTASSQGRTKDVAKYTQQIKDLKKELNAAGIPRNDLTLAIKRYEKALAQVMPIAETKKTALNREEEQEAEDAFEVVPGQRLRPRREGPVVSKAARAPNTMLSGTPESRVSEGRRNPPKQAGVIRLRASDLDPNTANAVSLATLDKKRQAATGEEKAKYQEAFDAATKNMTPEQIKKRLDEGNRLLASGPTLAIVAAKERFRAANETYKKALKALTDAENSVTSTFANTAAIKIAEDELDTADIAREKAEEAMHKAVADHAKNKTEESSVREADNAVEEDLDFTDEAKAYNRLNKAIDDADDEFFAAAAREAPGTVLPENSIKALLDGSLINALEQIAESEKGFLAEHADAVRQFLVRTKVEIVPEIIHEGQSVPALYDAGTNTVYFTPQGFTVEDVVHEATHAATMRVLTMPEKNLTPVQLAARRELEAMFKTLSKNPRFTGQYGMKNIKEFVSEVLANKDLRTLMSEKPWYKGNMVVQFFKKLFDLFRTNKLGEAMVPKAEALIKDIFMPSRAIANVEAVGAAPTYNSALIGSAPSKMENFRGNFLGLGGRVQYVDRLGAADAAIVAAEGANKLTSAEAFNTQYFMRMADQVSTAAGQFILHGPVKIVHEVINGVKEFRYESQQGANLVNMSEQLGKLAKALGSSNTEAERMATVLIAGERANAVPDGWKRLAGDRAAAVKAEYDADTRTLRNNAQAKAFFEAFRKEYKAYNDGQLDFAVDTDFMSKAEADRLKRVPYIPFYRIQNGVVQLITADEKPRTIGNIKDNPDLQQMVGDDAHILPVLTSAVQNTFMLTRMSLHNKATLETANALNKSGFVSRIGKGAGLANKDTVHYKLKGEDAFATIDSDTFGIPAHLIVRGMEGIKTTIPAIVQTMGIPAQWIRKFVTRMPSYGVRQLLRDPVNAFILSGVDGVPMVNALKELAKMQTGTSQAEQDLMRGLAVSSNVFSGNEKDMTKFLQDIQSGKSPWQTFLGKLDRFALQADTATRATVYEDSLKKGLSKARAQFRAFESQNLSRRGLSPSMQMANTLIPFFNSQIQGLDYLYRSLKGNVPFAEQLEIRRKIVARSMMLMSTSIAYAMMMQDDDDYRKASPEERYNNFFIHIPFVKEALKIPIPYEIGILFKALPEALIDSMHKDMTAYETAKGLGKVMLAAAPGVNPGATKPLIEAYYGQTSVGPIESEREKHLKATERYRPETTEVAKLAGKATGLVGISPIMLEHLTRGYTGSLGLAALHMVDPILASGEEGEKPSMPMNRMPFIGGLFQTSEGHYLIQRGYDRMNDIEQAKATYKDKIAQGKRAEAEAFKQEYINLLQAAPAAGQFKQHMGKLFEKARRVAADPNMTREEKDRVLEEIRDEENKYASTFVSRVNENTRQ